jgi:lipopolysaccharide/colanic/teichoic acid biosynthesis glycosyltransferase
MKRAFDIAGAAALLVVFSPVLALVACVMRLSGPGPIIYRGWRIGRYGLPFRILKFRTMTQAATAGGEITVSDDPRVTRLGRLLRATKLDELPQLLNVLKGEMSLVGPRPEAPRYVAQYTPTQREVLAVRPGITGPTQVLFRHEERMLRGPDPERLYLSQVMPAKLALDLDYVRNHSLCGDVQILARTVVVWAFPKHNAALPLPLEPQAATQGMDELASQQRVR